MNSGSRWWHDLLVQHPAVERRRTGDRELHFFDQFCTRAMSDADVAAYHSRFPRRPGRITGEWTPRYMYDAWTPVLLRRVAPKAKLLVLVADPVELYRSRRTLCMPDAAGRGRYASQVRRLSPYYDRDNILVLQYERCRLDPLGQYARMLRFLGVQDDFRPSTDPGVLRAAKRNLRLYRAGRPIDLWPEVERALLLALEPEVLELKAMVPDLDLTLWPRFAHLTA